MADIDLTLNGDSSGAVAAFDSTSQATQGLAEQTGKATVKWVELANVAKKAAEAVVRFGVDSVKMYAESERVQKQLTRAAGEYGDALGDVAKAQSRLYAVDDDIIKQSQTLLVQWGGVGAASKEVTQAVLDYASATGQDAVSATQELIRNVESGGVGLAKMGIHFTNTGDKGKNLANVVSAVSKKFGGAASTDASSLTGSTNAARLAFEDLQKSFGGLLATVAERSGVLSGITTILHNIADGADVVSKAFARLPGFLAEAVKGKGDATAALLSNTRGLADDILLKPPAALPGIGDVTGNTNKAPKGGGALAELHQQNLDEMREYQRGIDELDEHARQRDEESYADELERSAKSVALTIKEGEERTKIRAEMLAKIEKDNAEHNERMAKDEQTASDKATKDAVDRAKAKAHEAQRVGDQIGAALVNALTAQLEKLASGGEFDAALFIGDVLSSVFAVAASAIGTAYGMPALGAAIGNLGATGIRAGFGALSSSGKRARNTPTYHEGGWPRAHTGAWMGSDLGPSEVPVITETGERILSRGEVGNMGGPNAVDSMARGGSNRPAIYISALDAKSFADSMEGNGGRGMQNALRSGRGALPSLLLAAGGPR